MEQKTLKRELGFFSLIGLGIGSIIGAGIFVLPAVMSEHAGPGLLLSILIAGIITIFLALSYAELGAAFPITGGPYALSRLALGNLGGFVMGWGYFIYLFVNTAGIIDLFVVYLGYYIPGLTQGMTVTPIGISIAVIILWVFTLINVFGVKWGGLYSLVTAIGKVALLMLFVFIAFFFFKGSNFTPFVPYGITGVALTIPLFFWAYTGIEAIVVPAEEIKNPKVNIPLAMLVTIVTCILVYLVVAIAFVGMIDWEGLLLVPKDWVSFSKLKFPLFNAAQSLKLPWLASIVVIGAIIATAGTGGSNVLLQGRIPFAMAKDRLFWITMSKISPKYATPVSSLIFTSVLTTIILIIIPNFTSVVLISALTVIVPYAAAALSLMILRQTKKEVERPFKLPFAKFFTLTAFILATYLMYWASWPWTIIGISLMFIGFFTFLFMKRLEGEFKRNLWLLVYLSSILIVSIIGDKRFVYNNFGHFEPLNILTMPYDLLVLTIVAVGVYFWAYKTNIKYEAKKIVGIDFKIPEEKITPTSSEKI